MTRTFSLCSFRQILCSSVDTKLVSIKTIWSSIYPLCVHMWKHGLVPEVENILLQDENWRHFETASQDRVLRGKTILMQWNVVYSCLFCRFHSFLNHLCIVEFVRENHLKVGGELNLHWFQLENLRTNLFFARIQVQTSWSRCSFLIQLHRTLTSKVWLWTSQAASLFGSNLSLPIRVWAGRGELSLPICFLVLSSTGRIFVWSIRQVQA